MTDLEIADAIRREYERWDAEDVAANPRPDVLALESERLTQQYIDAEDEDADRIAGELEAALQREAANLAERDAYGQAREERWAARRAEFLTELGVG